MSELDVGSTPPPFELPADGGGTVKLAELHGKSVVVFFYPKDNTTACTLEAIDFSRLEPEFRAAGVRVLGISPDSLRKHAGFRKKHDLTVELLSDEGHAVTEAYGLWVEKTLYGRKYMGVERATLLIGPDGRIARVWRKVKVDGHAREVLDAARGLAKA
ncbi:MAG: peroxiredoxin [Rhizobiaceae bacterium]